MYSGHKEQPGGDFRRLDSIADMNEFFDGIERWILISDALEHANPGSEDEKEIHDILGEERFDGKGKIERSSELMFALGRLQPDNPLYQRLSLVCAVLLQEDPDNPRDLDGMIADRVDDARRRHTPPRSE